MADRQNTTARGRPGQATPNSGSQPPSVVCPACAKLLEGEPNFCNACGSDLRGIGGMSDTLSGPLKEKLIDGRYKLLEKLGEGGMGAVYKVEHVRMGKMAALKVLRPDSAVDKSLKGRFLQEARVVARLSHANTVQVFDSGELEDGSLFMAMEYVPGKDLAWHLKAHGPMSEEKAISIGVQVLASLQEAHELGIVHRDIKPANIMLVRRRKSGDDQVKLLDFGIAKLQEAEGRRSITGDFVGTPAYMSPEQIRGEEVDPRSDLYAVGALLFELVTGKPMYEGTPISIITQHTDAPIPRIADRAPGRLISPAFEATLHQALAKQRADRFQDAESMRVALEKLRRDLGALPAQYTPMPVELADKMLSREDFDRYERSLKVRRWLAPVIALLVVLAMGAFAWRTVKANESQLLTHEVEPNDLATQANRIPLSADVSGAIGAAAAGQGDRDLFVVDVPEGAVRVTLSGVPDLNLTMEFLQLERGADGERLKRRLFLDDVGVGQPERIDGLQVAKGPLYIRVEEKPFCTEEPRNPREKSLVPYTLRVDSLGWGTMEAEPDDTEDTAMRLPLTRPVDAWTGVHLDDVLHLNELRPDGPFSSPDWYRVDDVKASDTVAVAIVPPEKGTLLLLDKPDRHDKVDKADEQRVQVVRGGVAVIALKAGTGGGRLFRITTGEGTAAGESYRLAAGSSAENGLAGLVALAHALAEEGHGAASRQLVEQALRLFDKSPDAAQLRALQPH